MRKEQQNYGNFKRGVAEVLIIAYSFPIYGHNESKCGESGSINFMLLLCLKVAHFQ